MLVLRFLIRSNKMAAPTHTMAAPTRVVFDSPANPQAAGNTARHGLFNGELLGVPSSRLQYVR